MRFHIYHHYFERELEMANAALESELSSLVSVLSEKDSIIASQSVALESAVSGADSSAVSSAVSAAVDAEDTEIAASISSALSQG